MNLKDSQSSLTCLCSFVNFFYRGLKDICNHYKFVISSSSQGVKDFVRWIGSIHWRFPRKYISMLLARNPLMSNDDPGTSTSPQSLISSCITAILWPSLSIWRVQSEYHLMIDTQYSVNWTRIHFSFSRNYISKLVSTSVGLKVFLFSRSTPLKNICKIFFFGCMRDQWEPRPGMEPGPLAVEAWSPNHCTPREVP